jgi:hypothetical protein
MSVPLVWRAPDHVTSADFRDRLPFALGPAATRGDDEHLAERVAVPGRPCAGFKCHASAGSAGRIAQCEQRVDSDGTGEVPRGPLGRRLRTTAHDLHGRLPVLSDRKLGNSIARD